MIARSDSLQETGSLSYTPTAARPIGGGTTAVVADARLSTAFQGDMTKAGSSTLAVQKFLAQSLVIEPPGPDKQRSIVVAPQRMPTASQAQTMAQALHGAPGRKLVAAPGLAAAAAAKPDPSATTKVPVGVRRTPTSLRKQELPQSAFEEIQATQDRARQLQGDPHRPVPGGDPLRQGHRPGDVHLLAGPRHGARPSTATACRPTSTRSPSRSS